MFPSKEEPTFRGKVSAVQNKLQELKDKHFYEPNGADFCIGQVLKKNPNSSFHCYEPTCPQHWRHHQILRAELKRDQEAATDWKNRLEWERTMIELTSVGRGYQHASTKRKNTPLPPAREQIVVSEICEAFGQPQLRALYEAWQCEGSDKNIFDKLFDDTAQSLALFLKDEVHHLDQIKPPPAVEQNPELKDKAADLWMELKPQVKDTIKVLWQGDLNAEGLYLNIAMHIRRLSSRLLMHAMGKCLSEASPQDISNAAGHRSAGNKASFLTKNDPKLEPFADMCELIDRLATAIIHYKDAADFELASKSTGNTTIIICRGIVLACAKYMDWFGWSNMPSASAQDPFNVFIGKLKREFVKSTNEIESCTICYSRSLTYGFQHGNTVHFCACESCANMELKASVQRQQQKLQQQGAEQIPSEPLGLQSKQPVGQVVKPLCPQCKQPVDQLVKIIKDFIENGEGGSADPSSTQVPETRASPGRGVQHPSTTAPPEADSKRRRTSPVKQESAEEASSMHAEPFEAKDPKAAARLQEEMAAVSLEEKQYVDATLVEHTAAALWDEGQQEQAESTLREALSAMGPSPQKVILMLRLLEYSVQQLSLQVTQPQRAKCQSLVLDLSALITNLTAGASTSGAASSISRGDSSNSSSISPAMHRRFHFWRGRLQALLGRYVDAANAFYQAAAAAKQGGGDASRCFVEAAAALHAHAKGMEGAGQLSPALGAAEASLEAAHASGSTPYIIRAAVLGAMLRTARAEAAQTPRDYLPALQLYVLALKQLLQHKSPSLLPMTELRAADVEALAVQCRSTLERVVPLYGQEASSKPLAFVAEVERVLKDTAQLINAVKLQEEVHALGHGLEWMRQSAARVQRTLNALAKDTEWVQSLPVGETPPNSGSQQQLLQQQRRQPRPSTVFSHLAKHRHTLSSFWNKFDAAGFKGLPIPSDETESDRQLREAITRDVFRYFQEAGKQLMAQRGQKVPEGPPACSPKMKAFCEIVGFKLYMGEIKNKKQSPQPMQQNQAQTAASPTQVAAASMDTDPPAESLQQSGNRCFGVVCRANEDQKPMLTELAAVPHTSPGKQPQEWKVHIKQECSAGTTPPLVQPLEQSVPVKQESGTDVTSPQVACAGPTSNPQAAPIRPPQSTVTSFLNHHRQELATSWDTFDATGFKGLPIPSNETESDRNLREDITRDVYQYFEASAKQIMVRKGQPIPQGPSTCSPKMHAFVQTIAFKLYEGHKRKVVLKEKQLTERLNNLKFKEA